MKKKIILGTAQFFSKYGIDHSRITDKQKVREILNYAFKKKIRYLDTAISYKKCDKNLAKIGVKKWKIITKINFSSKDDKISIKKKILTSLKNLNIKNFHAILVHNAGNLPKKSFIKNYNELLKLKKLGLTKKVGISIYGKDKLDYFIKNFKMDIIQSSINFFDNRFLDYLKIKKIKKIEFHGRSIFLQGLLLKKRIPKNFIQFKKYFTFIKKFCNTNAISRIELLIYSALNQNKINSLVLGVNDKSQLEEIIKILEKKKVKKINLKKKLKIVNKFIDPRLWYNEKK